MVLELKPRTKEHVMIYWEKTQDEEIKRVFPSNIKSLEAALKLFDETLKEDAKSYGKVIYYQDRYVGDIWCYGIDELNEKMAMLSIVIFDKGLWGEGIAAEAVKEFVKTVFQKYQIDKIGAFTYSYNHRSIGLLRKTGFICVNTFIEDGVESNYYELSCEKI